GGERHSGPRPGERRGEEAIAEPEDLALGVVDRRVAATARGALRLEDEAVEVTGEGRGTAGHEGAHRLGEVAPAFDRAEAPLARELRCALDPDRLARRAHAGLDLRADRQPADERRERLDEERLALVVRVRGHALAGEAARDAESQHEAGAGWGAVRDDSQAEIRSAERKCSRPGLQTQCASVVPERPA